MFKGPTCYLLSMFGLSFTHLVILGVILLVVVGPEQLPELARNIARLLNDWKRATSDIQSTLVNTLRDDLHKPSDPYPNDPPKSQQETNPHGEAPVDMAAVDTETDIGPGPGLGHEHDHAHGYEPEGDCASETAEEEMLPAADWNKKS